MSPTSRSNAASGVGVQNDPLDRAVEKLWLNGVVVVAAAGNYAIDGAESGVGFAPANDPFVITVGASDTNGTVTPTDDFAAPWSAWGSHAGRLPQAGAGGTRARAQRAGADGLLDVHQSFPSRKVADGYMWMSGTSFAAPIVSGAAATVLSRHPDWTPDQVKGALMVVGERSHRIRLDGCARRRDVEHRRRRSRPTGAPTRTPGSTASSPPTRRRGEDVRRRPAGQRRRRRPGLERSLLVERELVVGFVVERELVVRFVVERELVVRFVVERELVVGFVVEHVRGQVAAEPRMSACLRSAVDTPIGGAAPPSQGR